MKTRTNDMKQKQKLKIMTKHAKKFGTPMFTKIGPLTICSLISENSDTGFVGLALCSNEDDFVKSEGRAIALSRVLHAMLGRSLKNSIYSKKGLLNLKDAFGISEYQSIPNARIFRNISSNNEIPELIKFFSDHFDKHLEQK